MIDCTVSDIIEKSGWRDIWFQDCVRIANEIEADITVLRLVGRQVHRPNAMPGHSTPGLEEYYRINV